MIDTHAHIYLPEFDADRPEMLQRAKDSGIEKIYMPNIDSSSIESMMALADTSAGFCLPMMGLHPCSVNADFKTALKIVEAHLANSTTTFYGVGECGLDYYWDKTLIAEQKEAFAYQAELAKRFRLPIIIHSREAVDDCIKIIADHKDENLRGIFHCFSGTADQLEKIIGLGFYAGIGGVATFKNGGLDQVLKPEHLKNLVLETDAPYLAPVPFRGKRNEPAYLTYVVEKLAGILNMSGAMVKEITTRNAQAIFK